MFSSLASYLFGNSNSDTDQKSDNQPELQPSATTSTTTKLSTNLSPVSDCIDIELLSTETEEDDWFLVNKEEEEEEESLPRTDSEEELPFVEIKRSPTNTNQQSSSSSSSLSLSRHRRSGSGCDNYCNNNNNTNSNNSSRNTSRTVSPVVVHHRHYNNTNNNYNVNDGTSQPLYAVSSSSLSSIIDNRRPTAISSMEESWFLTPPPCFTSTGPVNMETSPFENLLIEHPSMSVYHSIRSAQGATESFINLDLGSEEAQSTDQIVEQNPVRTVQNARKTPRRVEALTQQQLKEGLLLRNSQKIHDKKERQNICRGALKRGNKVRDFNSRGNRQRRSDMQHCKIISGANNNRKC